MADTVYAEWPPAHYYTPSEAELAEIAEAVSELDEQEFTITSAGYIGERVFSLPRDYSKFVLTFPVRRK